MPNPTRKAADQPRALMDDPRCTKDEQDAAGPAQASPTIVRMSWRSVYSAMWVSRIPGTPCVGRPSASAILGFAWALVAVTGQGYHHHQERRGGEGDESQWAKNAANPPQPMNTVAAPDDSKPGYRFTAVQKLGTGCSAGSVAPPAHASVRLTTKVVMGSAPAVDPESFRSA